MRLQLETAWIDELKIHDVYDPAAAYALRSAARTRQPRRVEQQRTFRHGIVDRTTPLFGAQTFDLAGYVDADTMAATEVAYDVLCGILAREGQRLFRFRRLGRAEDEQALVTLGGGPDAPQEGYGMTVKYAVSLVGADPRVYASPLKTGSYDPTGSLSGGGAPMPLVFPLVFSSTTTTQLIVSSLGNAKTPPVLTVKGPVANPIVDNDTTGESIYLLTTLGAADTIVVDVAARTVHLNGALRQDLFDASRSLWWEMPPGENALRLRGTGMVAAQTLLTVGFRDARL